MHTSYFHLEYLLWLLLLSSSFAATAVAVPASSAPPTAATSSPHALLSTVPDLPDERWDVGSRYERAPLAPDPAAMAVVFATQELASMDLDRVLRRDFTRTHPRFLQVAVTVVGGRHATTVRWAIWLLLSALREMMLLQHYRKSDFIGRWEGVEVAVLRMDPVVPAVVGEGKDLADDNADAADPAERIGRAGTSKLTTTSVGFSFDVNRGNGGTNASAPSNDDEFSANVSYLPKEVQKRDIYLMVLWLLMALAPKYSRSWHSCELEGPLITVRMKITWLMRPASVRVGMIGGDMVNLVAALPEELLRVDEWREMDISIEERATGVVLGKGEIRVQRMQEPSSIPDVVVS